MGIHRSDPTTSSSSSSMGSSSSSSSSTSNSLSTLTSNSPYSLDSDHFIVGTAVNMTSPVKSTVAMQEQVLSLESVVVPISF